MPKCEKCGVEFEPFRITQRFCTPKCRRRAEHNRSYAKGLQSIKYTCQHCGKEYHPKENGRNTYCSRECSFADPNNPMYTNRYTPNPKLTRVCVQCGEEGLQAEFYNSTCCSEECYRAHYIKECDICGSVFEAASTASRLCSDECRAEDARQRVRIREMNISGRDYSPFNCEECGGLVEIEYADKRSRFCSKECSNRHNGRIGKAIRRARKKNENGVIRKINPIRVCARDSWHCHICGIHTPREARGTREHNSPHVDHVIPLSRGGNHSYDNVRCSCRHCNLLKSDMLMDELEAAHSVTLQARRRYAREYNEGKREQYRRMLDSTSYPAPGDMYVQLSLV